MGKAELNTGVADLPREGGQSSPFWSSRAGIPQGRVASALLGGQGGMYAVALLEAGFLEVLRVAIEQVAGGTTDTVCGRRKCPSLEVGQKVVWFFSS